MKRTGQSLFSYLLIVTILSSVLVPIALAGPAAQGVSCAEEYIVQADDWLSKISDKLLGDVLAYPAIADATNQKHAADATFAEITNPDLIEIGWNLCVPGAEDAQALLTDSAAPQAVPVPLEPADLTVFAAASLTDVFNEVGQNFSAEHPGVTLTFNFAGSQQLAQQLG
jgi:hypothetical protein